MTLDRDIIRLREHYFFQMRCVFRRIVHIDEFAEFTTQALILSSESIIDFVGIQVSPQLALASIVSVLS